MPIDELTFRSLRGALGFVAQDVFLFQGTVRENLTYGRPDATDDEVVRAATLAEAHGFITLLPDGYDTVVGERGQKLSGGQRQRLTLARAILRDPAVLVLDEATSAVDNETEAAIQRSLERVSAGRTTIVIAHRLSTVRHAHRIHVLEAGQVIEAGTHEELLEHGGLYAALWRVQTGELSTARRLSSGRVTALRRPRPSRSRAAQGWDGLLVDGVLEGLADLHLRHGGRGDLDLRTRGRVATRTSGTLGPLEAQEARHLHLVATGDSGGDHLFERREHGAHCCSGLSRLLRDSVDEFGLVHRGPP